MSKPEKTRETAYEALLAIAKNGGQSHLVIRDVLQAFDAGKTGNTEDAENRRRRDRAFLTRLIEGTVEYRLQLDYVISLYSRTPLPKMKPQIREILRMAVYQILHMDSVPDRAAVSEAVDLTVKKGFSGLRGFVNGVLRTIAREKGAIVWPDPEKEPVRYISVFYSVGEDIVSAWTARCGREKTEAICRSFLESRPLCVHCFGSAELTGGEMLYRPSGYLPEAWFLHEDCGNPAELPDFRRGSIYIQDLSSQIAVSAAGIRPGDRVLDLCAAPGGKSLLAAERCCLHDPDGKTKDMSKEAEGPDIAADGMSGSAGSVLARDLTPEKTARIRENVLRCRRTNVDIETADARVFDPGLENRFDVVIADLPCSGFGVAGKKPEIKYKSYRETVTELSGIQRQILGNAVRYVRPGGTLLYSTCTIAAEENEDMAAWLVKQYGLQPVDLRKVLPEALSGIPGAGNGYVQLLPCDGPWDGFFFSVFTRPEMRETERETKR